jgi:hypothetical protein
MVHLLKRTALGALVLLAHLPAAAQPQEDSEETRAQKYLSLLGQAWAKQLPADQTLGIYFGRRWVGQATIAVKAAPAGGAGAFDLSLTSETKISGKRLSTRERVVMDKTLTLISAESFEESPEGKVSKSLTVQAGRWKLRREEKGKTTYQEGALLTGSTWNASFLPLFGRPADLPVKLPCLDGGLSPIVLSGAEAKAKDAKDAPGPAEALEVRRGEGPPGIWLFSSDGQPLEFRPGQSPIKFRPVRPSEAGKDLQEPLVIKEPVKALVDLFRSVKRGDRSGVVSAFDFEKLAGDLVPGYADLDAASKRQVQDALRTKMPTDLLAAKFRDGLPEESFLEDFLSSASEVTQDGGSAEVRLLEKSTVWKLSRVEDGKLKGRWLVSGLKP